VTAESAVTAVMGSKGSMGSTGSMRARAAVALLVAGALAASACSGDDADAHSGDSGLSATSTTGESPGETTQPGQTPLADVSLTLTEVASADQPTAIVTRPETDVLYVVEKAGTVRQLAVTGSGADRSYQLAGEALLDISGDVTTEGEEQGLLDAEFSPDGSELYVHYSAADSGDTQIDAFTVDGDRVDTSSRRSILSVEQPYPNHNGGEIEFGPDGYFYIGLGDGGDAGDPEGNGQNTGVLLGKILRIDPLNPGDGREYAIPSDNPFADGDGGAPEVWLYGARNPWRFSFDPETDDLWVADVGQNEWEEIDLLPAADGGGRGANLGWDRMEGSHSFEGDEPDDDVLPVYEYSHDEGGCSVTGGVVYRGSALSGLAGAYLFSDYCQGTLRAIRVADGAVADEHVFDAEASTVSSLGVDAAGDVYVVSLDGAINRLDPA
jgi:glucose/arabinose dehydrogenase